MCNLNVKGVKHPTSTETNIQLYADGSTSIRNLQNLAPNMIINGAMQLWQRSDNTGVPGYSVDRFKGAVINGAFNQEKIDLTGGEPFTEGFRSAYRMTNTTPDVSGSSARVITHLIEGNVINASGWNWASPNGKATLSFWVRSSVNQDFMAYLNTEAGTPKFFPIPFSCVAGQWTKVTKVIPGDVGISISNTNDRGLGIDWAPYWGDNYTTSAGPTLDQWSNWDGTNRAKDYGNGAGTWGGTTNATFDITGVQLTATDAPIEFQHEDYATTLAKCQRYYTAYTGTAAAAPMAYNRRNDDRYRAYTWQFPTTMREVPVVTGSSSIATDSFSAASCPQAALYEFVTTTAAVGGSARMTNMTADAEL